MGRRRPPYLSLALALGSVPPGLTHDQLAGLVWLRDEAEYRRQDQLTRAFRAALARA
jgi:hypothetical protein